MVTGSPTSTVAGVTVALTERSASPVEPGVSVICACALLLPGCESALPKDTLAVTSSVAEVCPAGIRVASAVPCSVIVALSPCTRLRSVQVSGPPGAGVAHAPCDGVTTRPVRRVRSAKPDTVTREAMPGPRLVTVAVTETTSPGATVWVAGAMVRARSGGVPPTSTLRYP